jgi:hypothetical protein
VVYRADKRGQPRVVRMVYEVATFQALRDQLRCKEIWVVGADRAHREYPAEKQRSRGSRAVRRGLAADLAGRGAPNRSPST